MPGAAAGRAGIGHPYRDPGAGDKHRFAAHQPACPLAHGYTSRHRHAIPYGYTDPDPERYPLAQPKRYLDGGAEPNQRCIGHGRGQLSVEISNLAR